MACLMDILKLNQKKASDKILCDKAFNIAKNLKYDRCQKGLASMVYTFLIKRFLVVVIFADIHLIRKFNKGIHFLLCVIDIVSKYTWAIPLKDKKRY